MTCYLALGVAEGEFETPEQLVELLKKSFLKLTFHDCDANDRIVSLFMYYPSPLSRSHSPIHAGNFLVFCIVPDLFCFGEVCLSVGAPRTRKLVSL